MILDSRYDEIMERIEVTPEMRCRILEKLSAAALPEKRERSRVLRWQRLVAVAACLAIVLAGMRALPGLLAEEEPPDVLLPSGFTVVEDAAALETAVDMVTEGVSHLPFTPETVEYSYLDGMAQIVYRAGAQEAVWRKAPGNEDISGDHTNYAQTAVVDGVLLKGAADSWRLAVWTDGNYSYALSLAPGASLAVWRDILTAQGIS